MTPGNDWRIIDPSDPSQQGYFYVPFNDVISDNLSPFVFYKHGAVERFDFRSGKMGLTHRLSNGREEVTSLNSLTVDQWTHIVSQIDSANGIIRMYKNGEQILSHPFSPSEPSVSSGQDWFFGLGNLGYEIDETRISSVARSADWIEACFDNQKPEPGFPSTSGVKGNYSFTSSSSFILNAEEYFTHIMKATDDPVEPSAFVASGLPAGLLLNPSDGNLSGTPSTAGEYKAQIRAIYPDGLQATESYDFKVHAGPPSLAMSSPQSVGANSLGVDYEITATGGEDPQVYLVADISDHGKDLYKWKFRLDLGKRGLGMGNAVLEGLDADKIYYLRMLAINSAGEHWTGKESRIRLQPELIHLPVGLGIWFDSTDVLANKTPMQEGIVLNIWRDKSNFGRDMVNTTGDPLILNQGYGGKPVVDFDGNDQMWTDYDFSDQAEIYQWRNMGYTAFGLSLIHI